MRTPRLTETEQDAAERLSIALCPNGDTACNFHREQAKQVILLLRKSGFILTRKPGVPM